MLLPGSRFDLNFTTVDSTGANTAPTGTPTWVLLKNGAATAVTGNATMTGSQGYVTTTIPNDAVAGDRFAIRVTAVVSGLTQEIPGPSESIADLAAIATAIRSNLATELGRVDVAISSRLATVGYTAPTTPPTAAAIASQVRTELGTELGRVDVAVSSRLATAGYTAPPSVAGLATSVEVAALGVSVAALPNAEDIAAEILIDPANKLLTNESGLVTSTNTSDVLVMPMRSSVAGRVVPNRIELFIRELIPLEIPIVDSRRVPVDCTGIEAEFLTADGEVISGLMPTGTPPHKYTVTTTEALTLAAGSQKWSLRVANSTERVLAEGVMSVEEVP